MHAAASPTAMSRLPSKQEAEAYIAKHGLAKHLQDALNTTIAEGVDDYTVRPLERIADLLYDAAPPERTHKPLIKQGTFALNAGSQKLFDLDHGATAASSLGRSPSRRGGLAAMKEAAQLHSALKAAHEEIKRLREKNALGIKHSTLAVVSMYESDDEINQKFREDIKELLSSEPFFLDVWFSCDHDNDDAVLDKSEETQWKKKVEEARLVVCVVTDAYQKEPRCMDELHLAHSDKSVVIHVCFEGHLTINATMQHTLANREMVHYRDGWQIEFSRVLNLLEGGSGEDGEQVAATDRLREEVLGLVADRVGKKAEDLILLGVQGSVVCYNDKSPAVCTALGRRLAAIAEANDRFVLIVGGMTGVNELVSNSFCEARKAQGHETAATMRCFCVFPQKDPNMKGWVGKCPLSYESKNYLPGDTMPEIHHESEWATVSFGSWSYMDTLVLKGAQSIKERDKLFASMPQIVIEGGPQSLSIAEAARSRRQFVFPIGAMGGAGENLSKVYHNCPIEKEEENWKELRNPENAHEPEKLASAAHKLVEYYMADPSREPMQVGEKEFYFLDAAKLRVDNNYCVQPLKWRNAGDIPYRISKGETLEELTNIKLSEALQPSGLKWSKVLYTPTGEELINNELSEALKQKEVSTEMRDAMKPIEFTEDEWKAFGVENLHVDHFIKAGESYFQQTVEHKKEFKEDEWKAFGIENLHMNHFIKSGELYFQPVASLPRFQDVRDNKPNWIVRRGLTLEDVCRGSYVEEYAAVSHRWDKNHDPDPWGEQLKAIKLFLKNRKRIKWIWIDYCCMPQDAKDYEDAEGEVNFDEEGVYKPTSRSLAAGARTEAEYKEFKTMLPDIGLIFLGCRVLLVIDLTYQSRFWTQYEAWLSMQRATIKGLAATPTADLRCTMMCIQNATEHDKAGLIEIWHGKSVNEAREVLSRDDICVTNLKDKPEQLNKIGKVDEMVRNFFKAWHEDAGK